MESIFIPVKRELLEELSEYIEAQWPHEDELRLGRALDILLGREVVELIECEDCKNGTHFK